MRKKLVLVFAGAVMYFIIYPLLGIGAIVGLVWGCFVSGFDQGLEVILKTVDRRKKNEESSGVDFAKSFSKIVDEMEKGIKEPSWKAFVQGWKTVSDSNGMPAGRVVDGEFVTFAKMLEGKNEFEARRLGEIEGADFEEAVEEANSNRMCDDPKCLVCSLKRSMQAKKDDTPPDA